MEIIAAKSLLKVNDQIAARNRDRLQHAGVFAVNLLGSPGAGKTALLEALLPALKAQLLPAVIEGDLSTNNDALRVEKTGVPAVQINTEGGCHLDANMVASALDALGLEALDLLFIENVGNLVCTASYRLGEHMRVVVLSVTEGDDKVEKYPPMFQNADLLLVNKIDLLPYVDFNLEKVAAQARRLRPDIAIMQVSARQGTGMEPLADFIVKARHQCLGSTSA